MGGFGLVNLDFDWQATEQASVVFGVRNLFDRNYELVEGYPEPGQEGMPMIRPDDADTAEVGQSLIARAFERKMAVRNTPVVRVAPRRVANTGERLLRTERPTAETGPTVVSFSDIFAAASPSNGS